MQFRRERLAVKVAPRAEMFIWDDLRQDYKAYVHEVKSEYWQAFHLPFVESGERIHGELYLADQGVLMYYAVDPRGEYIEAGCVMPHNEGEQIFQGFCERIKDMVLPGGREKEPFWSPYTDRNDTFDLVREEAQRLALSPEQISAAAALTDPSKRSMLRTILGARSMLMDQLANGRPPMEVGQEVGLLESLGLIQKEFVVFCRDAGNQISRVNSFAQIEEATRRGFKCFSCGRPIAEERIDQLLAATPAGVQLARKNYWLGLVVANSLEHLGIKRTDMLMRGADSTLDLFINHDGTLVMFEIKEDEVRLEDVFLFFSRLGYYKPHLGFYMTTRPVSAEVKKYLSGGGSVPVTLIEDLTDIEEQVRRVASETQRDHVRKMVARLEPGTRVDVGDIVYEYFFGKEEKVREVLIEAAESVVGPIIADSGAAEEQAPVEEAAVPMLDPAEVPQPVIEPAQVDEPLAVEESVPVGAEPEQDPSMRMHEELLDTPIIIEDMPEVLEVEDLMPAERPLYERLEQVLGKVVEDLNGAGVLGRADALAGLLDEITAIPNHVALLTDESGLVLAQAWSDGEGAEMSAALATEVHDVIVRGLEELGLPRATRIQVDSQGDRFVVRGTETGVLIMLREHRPLRELEEETASALPGEMVLREAMLKKVLEDLSMVEGIRGNIVAGRDGLLIECLLESEDVPPDITAAVMSQMVVDNERSLGRLKLLPLRQMLVKDGVDLLVSLIPLDKEGILITMLDPTTPREVWQNRLYAAANMLTSVFQ
ncbi:MAG: hypothetical protein FJX76_06895 [Armatimonadetes bacterium]|nr:hypothetical protein [Armatimonadota bacterium]